MYLHCLDMLYDAVAVVLPYGVQMIEFIEVH